MSGLASRKRTIADYLAPKLGIVSDVVRGQHTNPFSGLSLSPMIHRKCLQGSHVLLNLRRLAMNPHRHPSVISSSTQLVSGRGRALSELRFNRNEESAVIELETMYREDAD